MASPSTVLTMGMGAWGSASLLLTLGYGGGAAGVLGPYCFCPTVATVSAHAVMSQSATHVLSIAGADHAIAAHGATHVLSVAAATHAVKAGCDCE